MNKTKITKTGNAAIQEAESMGAPLYVRDLTGHWQLGNQKTLERAKATPQHANWIYGTK